MASTPSTNGISEIHEDNVWVMLPHNSDRLGAVHGASHGSETKLRQEHKHRLYEERVVVNDDDTSVPLKRHYILQSLPGATPASDICVHVRPQLAKGARLPRSRMRFPWPARGGSRVSDARAAETGEISFLKRDRIGRSQ